VPGTVDQRIGSELRRQWDDGEIVELTGVIALFGVLNRWHDAMATELEAPAAADGKRWLAGKHQKTGLKRTSYRLAGGGPLRAFRSSCFGAFWWFALPAGSRPGGRVTFIWGAK